MLVPDRRRQEEWKKKENGGKAEGKSRRKDRGKGRGKAEKRVTYKEKESSTPPAPGR